MFRYRTLRRKKIRNNYTTVEKMNRVAEQTVD